MIRGPGNNSLALAGPQLHPSPHHPPLRFSLAPTPTPCALGFVSHPAQLKFCDAGYVTDARTRERRQRLPRAPDGGGLCGGSGGRLLRRGGRDDPRGDRRPGGWGGSGVEAAPSQPGFTLAGLVAVITVTVRVRHADLSVFAPRVAAAGVRGPWWWAGVRGPWWWACVRGPWWWAGAAGDAVAVGEQARIAI